MGTSLKVHPFAMLPALVPHECPRLLLNLEPAGGIGAYSHHTVHLTNKNKAKNDGDEHEDDKDDDEDGYGTEEEDEAQPAWVNDVVHLGPCDKSVRELCDLLGWRSELEALWKELGGAGSGAANDQSATPAANVNHIANRNGADNFTADRDDHKAVDEGKGKSIEVDESEKKSQRDQSEGKTTHALEGQEAGDLAGGKDNSVEKTLELIIQDMEETLKLSAKGDANADEHRERDRAPDSNA
jgi:NAD+-dependent protein deacetylase SIR2